MMRAFAILPSILDVEIRCALEVSQARIRFRSSEQCFRTMHTVGEGIQKPLISRAGGLGAFQSAEPFAQIPQRVILQFGIAFTGAFEIQDGFAKITRLERYVP